MHNKKKIFALIPARGRSKGLPDKNILPLSGKPLIAWTIEAAQKSQYIDRVVVSTEDQEIAGIARQYRAEIPFSRPKNLASNEAKTTAVALHALQWLKKNNDHYDVLVLLQPTSPFRSTEDIDRAIDVFFRKKAQVVVSVCKTEHHPYWSNQLPDDGNMKEFINKRIINKNRQALPQYYRLNGAIYIAYTDYLIQRENFFGEETYAFVMPALRSVDIDNKLDFDWAEFLVGNKPKT